MIKVEENVKFKLYPSPENLSAASTERFGSPKILAGNAICISVVVTSNNLQSSGHPCHVISHLSQLSKLPLSNQGHFCCIGKGKLCRPNSPPCSFLLTKVAVFRPIMATRALGPWPNIISFFFVNNGSFCIFSQYSVFTSSGVKDRP